MPSIKRSASIENLVDYRNKLSENSYLEKNTLRKVYSKNENNGGTAKWNQFRKRAQFSSAKASVLKIVSKYIGEDAAQKIMKDINNSSKMALSRNQLDAVIARAHTKYQEQVQDFSPSGSLQDLKALRAKLGKDGHLRGTHDRLYTKVNNGKSKINWIGKRQQKFDSAKEAIKNKVTWMVGAEEATKIMKPYFDKKKGGLTGTQLDGIIKQVELQVNRNQHQVAEVQSSHANRLQQSGKSESVKQILNDYQTRSKQREARENLQSAQKLVEGAKGFLSKSDYQDLTTSLKQLESAVGSSPKKAIERIGQLVSKVTGPVARAYTRFLGQYKLDSRSLSPQQTKELNALTDKAKSLEESDPLAAAQKIRQAHNKAIGF
ncbi:MAG: hypothetical protein AAF483_09905, partial [Planctomycetota bacterium]